MQSRRILIGTFAALSGLALTPRVIARAYKSSDLRFGNNPFQVGVASGSPSSDGFVLWTRLIAPELQDAGAVPVSWEVFEGRSGRGRVVASGEALAEPALGHAVHVEVSGLYPDAWYGYRFMIADATSSVGRARTLPARTAKIGRLRMALASCQRWESGHYAAYRDMLAQTPDFVVFVGDYIYEKEGKSVRRNVRTHELPEAQSLETYRARYALYKSDPALQAMHAACPWLTTWDDHELENNYGGAWSVTDTPDFAARRIASYQAYYEHMPLRAGVMLAGLQGLQTGKAPLRIHSHYDFGRLARIYLLDNRQYRDRPLCGKAPTKAAAKVCFPEEPAERRSMLGREQEQWLDGALHEAAQSGVSWNLIAQQSRFTPANYPKGKGVLGGVDGWDGFPDARQRLIDALVRTGASNPVILGGDIHRNWVAQVHRDPYSIQSPVVAAEYCGTSISSRASNASEEADLKKRQQNPHCLFLNSRKRGYGLLDLTPEKLTVTLRGVDNAAEVHSRVNTLATFVTEAGRSGVRQGG